MREKTRIKSDEELMQEYAAGNVEAFDELFERYGQKIYNLFLRSTGNVEIAQDLVQECFLRMTEARQRYRPVKAFSSWLITIAMNLLRDKFREKRRRKVYLSQDSFENQTGQLSNSEGRAEKKIENNQLREVLEKAIRELPYQQRMAIILSKYHDLSFNEIGDMLNITPAAAKQKAYRGMQTLRKKLSFLKEE